jgi:hypothetical protein
MKKTTNRRETSRKSDSRHGETASGGLIGTIVDSFVYAWRSVKSFVDGLAQDFRRAGLTLMWLTALGAFAALLMITAWLALMAAMVLWLVSLGIAWAVAVATVAGVNVLAAVVAIFICYRLSRNLLLPITRRKFE